MFVVLKNIDYLHFWGENLYIYTNKGRIEIKNTEMYIFRSLIQLGYDVDKLSKFISCESGIDLNTVNQIIEKFIKKYSYIIELSDSFKSNILQFYGKFGCTYPNYVTFYLTTRCYHRCKHCFRGEYINNQEIEFEEIKRCLNFLSGKTRKIQFTGGEPLLYKNIKELLYSYGDKFKIYITTSAYEISKELLLALKNVELLQISIYSHKEDLNDSFMGTKGALRKVIENIKLLQAEGIKIKVSNIITCENMNDIEEYIQFLINMDIKEVQFGKIVKLGNAMSNPQLILNQKEFICVKQVLKSLREKYKREIIINDWEEGIVKTTNESIFLCDAGKLSWSILENGDIQPCSLFTSPELYMGNIKNNSYYELINGLRLKKIHRNWVNNKNLLNNINVKEICDNIFLRGD